MSGLNIRHFAKVEPLNGDATSVVQQDRAQRQPEIPGNDSDDSDEGIQYLAPDQTLAGKCSIAILGPHVLSTKYYLHPVRSP